MGDIRKKSFGLDSHDLWAELIDDANVRLAQLHLLIDATRTAALAYMVTRLELLPETDNVSQQVLTPFATSWSCEVHQLVVRDDCLCQGLGSIFMRWAIRNAKDIGFERVTLNSRQGAQHFYAKLNFRWAAERHPGPNDTVPMELAIRDMIEERKEK